jgi:hypothetical protein
MIEGEVPVTGFDGEPKKSSKMFRDSITYNEKTFDIRILFSPSEFFIGVYSVTDEKIILEKAFEIEKGLF